MPGVDGITFLRAARAEFGPERPAHRLLHHEAEMSRISGAEAGAKA